MNPVQILYHGTSLDYVESIENKGLISVNDKVYLTTDLNVAFDYANKAIHRENSFCSQCVICIVDAVQMVKDGFEFDFVNNEYIVTHVPSKYIIQVALESEEELPSLAHYAQEQVYTVNKQEQLF